jgi:hypothetical protein
MIKLWKRVLSIGLKTMGMLSKIRQLEGDKVKETKKRKDPPPPLRHPFKATCRWRAYICVYTLHTCP